MDQWTLPSSTAFESESKCLNENHMVEPNSMYQWLIICYHIISLYLLQFPCIIAIHCIYAIPLYHCNSLHNYNIDSNIETHHFALHKLLPTWTLDSCWMAADPTFQGLRRLTSRVLEKGQWASLILLSTQKDVSTNSRIKIQGRCMGVICCHLPLTEENKRST